MRGVLTALKAPRSQALAGSISVLVFVLAVWLPNFRLLFSVWADTSVSLWDKTALPMSLLPSIATNFTLLSASYTIVIAVLAGVNAALMAYLARTRGMLGGGAAIGLSGMFTGTLGLGCAACGSLILTSIVSVGGIGVLALLPLGGSEFGLVGVAFLGYSTYLLAKQITKPLVC